MCLFDNAIIVVLHECCASDVVVIDDDDMCDVIDVVVIASVGVTLISFNIVRVTDVVGITSFADVFM